MRQPVNKNVVDLVAKMLTDDPDILLEADIYPQRSKRSHVGRGTGRYEAEEVPLDRTTLGSVIYDYEVKISGGWYNQTHDSPEESPNIEIGKIVNMDVVGYDDNGEEIQPSPEQLRIWTKSAVDFFHSKLEDKVAEQEIEKLSEGEYDYEPDEDQFRRMRTGEDF